MDAVTSFGHIRSQTAMKVPIAEARDFLKKGCPQAGFEMSPEAQRARSDRELQEEKCRE